jgi:hypothetical protein
VKCYDAKGKVLVVGEIELFGRVPQKLQFFAGSWKNRDRVVLMEINKCGLAKFGISKFTARFCVSV